MNADAMKHVTKGFTLIELAVVTAAVGLLAMVLLPSLVDLVENRRIDAERATLVGFEEDIRRSFQDTDWSRNIAAFSGAMPAQLAEQYATVFGSYATGTPAGLATWYVKLGRMRGIVPVVDAEVSADQQKSLYDLAFNAYGQARLLIAAPTEPNQQRYLILSLEAPSTKGLEIPVNDGSTDWFDAIWNNDWENEAGALPSSWVNRLSGAQQQAWLVGKGTTTNCHRLIVRRIVQPKFSITLNDSHPSLHGWIDVGGQTSVKEIGPNSGPVTADGILAGSLVIFRRGPAGAGTEVFRIHLNDNTAFSVMSQP